MTPCTLPVASPSIVGQVGAGGDAAMAMLNAEINRQALMIAYLDDFHLMMLVTLASLPLVWLLRKPRAQDAAPPIMAD